MSDILKAEGIRREFRLGAKRIPVLRGVDLEVREGELLCIVGASGVGKSTLLHILGLLDRPTSGRVFLEGRELSRLSEGQRSRLRNEKVGFVFQFYHLLPEFTAMENVLLPSLVRGGTRRSGRRNLRERAASLLDRVGLGDRLDHRPSELSGGEQQRVAVARALMNEPDVVLADEPTGNLDTVTSEEICDLIRNLNRERGQTFLVVTHDRSLSESADRVLNMVDGVLFGDREKERA